MTPVFADTAYYVALLNQRDALHQDATTWLANEKNGILTTEFILLEVANFFIRPGKRDKFVILSKRVRSDVRTTLIPLSSDWMSRGLALFAARPDKDWSLTDCISFVVMADHNLTGSLTADRHFEQAGFQCLLA